MRTEGVDDWPFSSYLQGAMYANAPHASATTPPASSLQHAPHVQHGQPHGMPPAAHPGGSHGVQGQAMQAPMAAAAHAAPRPAPGAAFVTGAYQLSGDPAIDRMLRLEAACKRFGSPF